MGRISVMGYMHVICTRQLRVYNTPKSNCSFLFVGQFIDTFMRLGSQSGPVLDKYMISKRYNSRTLSRWRLPSRVYKLKIKLENDISYIWFLHNRHGQLFIKGWWHWNGESQKEIVHTKYPYHHVFFLWGWGGGGFCSMTCVLHNFLYVIKNKYRNGVRNDGIYSYTQNSLKEYFVY